MDELDDAGSVEELELRYAVMELQRARHSLDTLGRAVERASRPGFPDTPKARAFVEDLRGDVERSRKAVADAEAWFVAHGYEIPPPPPPPSWWKRLLRRR